MKKLCMLLLCVLMVLWSASALAEDMIVTGDGLMLLSPETFFDGRYTFFNAVDNTDNGSTWTTFSFRLNGDATYDEVEADAERYRQALINSGYFKPLNEKMKISLVYIGNIEVSSATIGGKDQGWQVNVNTSIGWASMDIPHAIQVNLVKGFSFSDVPYDTPEQETVATEKPQNQSKTESKSVTNEIAWDDGRMIADPGDFLGYEIELLQKVPGDNDFGGFMRCVYEAISMDDIVKLVNALDASPYFTYSGGSGGVGDKYFWLRRYDYVGPDSELTALCESGREEQYGRKGDLAIYVYNPSASESRFALHEYPGFTVNSSMNTEREDNDQVGDRCSFCDGDGKCNECGGDNWVWAWEWVYVNGSPRQEQVNKICEGIYCNGGACSKCGGDGVR